VEEAREDPREKGAALSYDIAEIRSHFPSLQSGNIFFDNPGGTQVPQQVIDAVGEYYKCANSNTHGAFESSRRTDQVIAEARAAFSDFFNARSPDEVVFGPNMTSLTFSISRALGRWLNPGDEIIVTRLDHDANIAPWLGLEERGARIKWVDIHADDCTLDMADFEKQLSTKTKIVAVGGASNAVGSLNDLKTIVPLAHLAGAIVFIDAVHFAPHIPIDVQELDCDLLACSAYKFYGPHLGALYGKRNILDRLSPYKVRPSSNQTPDKFETGTMNHEGLAGATAAINYLASIGETYGAPLASRFQHLSDRRLALKKGMAAIQDYERDLFIRLMRGLCEIHDVQIYGITDFARFRYRTPTVAFNLPGRKPREIAQKLGREKIFVWDGNYYALALMERLGLEEHGGAVRVGLAHYNTDQEVDCFLSVMKSLSQ
jgi:cysteine desulfurase family protein (TIGR01976 family)